MNRASLKTFPQANMIISPEQMINQRKFCAGEGLLCWRPEEEEMVEELKRELRAKEETIEALKSHLASLEQDKHKSEREADILRQSLRIMSNKNGAHTTTRKLT